MEQEVKRDPFKSRIHEIDFFRGLLMCLVILDHLFNLLMSFNKGWAHVSTGENIQPFYTIYQVANFYWTNPARTIVRWICLGSFCFVSGVSSAFSKNNWKRAGEMIILWFLILIGSNILQAMNATYDWNVGIRTFRVDFNIIGVLAWSTLFYCFTQNKTWRSILAGLLISFLMCWYVVPWLQRTPMGSAYAPALWPPEGQADLMPLFPYICFFFGGAIVTRFIYKDKKSIIYYFTKEDRTNPNYLETKAGQLNLKLNMKLSFITYPGKHTLLIYIFHQPAITIFFGLIFLMLGATLNV